MAGYQQALSGVGDPVVMEDIFGEWSVANFLDDPALPDGQYGYQGEELPPFHAFRTHTTFPASGLGNAQQWASEYIRLVVPDGAPTLEFDGQDARDFRVALMAVDPTLPPLVTWLNLDEANDGSLTWPAASGYAEVLISVANVHPSQVASYSYTVGTTVTAVPGSLPEALVLDGGPNPFNPRTTLAYRLVDDGPVRLAIHDSRGRLVKVLEEGFRAAGSHRVAWDGVTDQGSPAASGLYLVRLSTQGGERTLKITLAK